MKCRHKWQPDPPQPNEAFCTECGVLFTGRGRPRKGRSAPTETANVMADIANELAGMSPEPKPDAPTSGPYPWEVEDGPVESFSSPVPTVALDIPKPPPTWCKMAGRRISQAYVMVIEGACARFAKRQTTAPEDEDVTELGNALGEQMAIWFPDSELTPLAKVGLAAASIAATMVVGSTPIAPAPSVTTMRTTADVAPTAETPTENEPRKRTPVKLPIGLGGGF